MMIGHIPVGYFVTRHLLKKMRLPISKLWLGLGIVAAVFPDLDYIYWFFSNSQSDTHRGYITSYPLFYLAILSFTLIIYGCYRRTWLKFGMIIVSINILSHFILDTVFYGIKWLYPLSDRYFGLYNVGGWGSGVGIQVDNYFHHWYWYLEIIIWVIAIFSIIVSNKKGEFKNV